jgi:glycosyltransferase involved in cell wall biosynthesis
VDYARWERRRREGQHIVFTDNISLVQVQALYSRADLFVFPTFADTFPMVILEAMAYGCAIVSTPVGGIPYQVNEDCAVLVPPGDTGQLSRVLDELLVDKERLDRMGAASASAGERRVGWRESAHLAIEAYDKVLAART